MATTTTTLFKMLTFTLILLICQHISINSGTRLPLEVYELAAPPPPPQTAAVTLVSAATTNAASEAAASHLNYLKHKNFEYATINAKTYKQITNNTTKTLQEQQQQQQEKTTDIDDIIDGTTDTASAAVTTNNNNNSKVINEQQQQQQHRRSRQMLDILAHEQRQQHDALHFQKLQQQQQQQTTKFHNKDILRKQHTFDAAGMHNAKDVRILYQVGEAEDDLPVCAPNAVCSKIDLYETPWIERQCRCPEVNHMPNIIIHHHQHGHHQHHEHEQNKENVAAQQQQQQQQQHNEKYRSYYEHEKMLQRKHLLVGDFNDKKFESLHLKKLMHKLGAVYEDDLNLHPSDFLTPDDNDAIPGLHTAEQLTFDEQSEDEEQQEPRFHEINNNEFPHGPAASAAARRNYYATATANTAHMRHSAHNMAHKAKEAAAAAATSFIGGCPSGLGVEDGHTIADKTRHYKLCQPVHKLPICKHFRENTWTLTTSAELNVTEQIVHCRCPKNSVTYLRKREATADGTNGYKYLFACSPLTRIRCQRKQPCKLFTVRKRQEFLDEVNINALCQCPKGHHCPSHHTQSGVIAGESFLEDNIQTYSGYCMAND